MILALAVTAFLVPHGIIMGGAAGILTLVFHKWFHLPVAALVCAGSR